MKANKEVLEKIKLLDKLMNEIYQIIRETNLTDEEVATSEKVKNLAFEMVRLLKSENFKTTYNNLTNSNFHTLVKILNYNGFFPKNQLSKEYSNELKTFSLI